MRINVILIFLISFGALLGVTVMRSEDSLLAERNLALNVLLEGQTSGIGPALDAEVKSLSHDVVLGFEILSKEKPEDFDLGQAYSRFQMLAKLNPTGNGDWDVVESHFRKETAVKAWAASYTKAVLKAVDPEKVIRGSVQFFTLLDPNRTPHLMIFHRTGRNEWYSGVLGADAFQALMDRQKGSGSEVFVVNQTGQVIGHGTTEYIGSLLTEDPIVKELMKSSKVRGTLDVTKSKKKLRAIFEQIPTTNLYLVVASPITPSTAFRSAILMPLLAFGLAIFVVALALLLLFDRPPKMMTPVVMPAMSPSLNSVMSQPSKLGSVPTVPSVGAFPSSGASATDRSEAFKVSASALAHEMKLPFLGILAQVQKLKVNHPAAAAEVEGIEKLAREGRSSLQKIFSFTGEDLDNRIEPFNPVDVIVSSLQKVQPLFSKKGITVDKDTKPVKTLKGSSALLQKALVHVLTNAAEAMEHSVNKKLRIEIAEAGGNIEVRIKDTGEGIAGADVLKIFDPFFTSRKAKGHMGMGLAAAHAIVKEMGGRLSVEQTEPKKGTTILFQIPLEGVASSTSGSSAPHIAAVPQALPSTASPQPLPLPVAAPTKKPELAMAVKKGPELIPQASVDFTLQMIDELDPAPSVPTPKEDFGDLDIPTVIQAVPSIGSLKVGSADSSAAPSKAPSAAPPPSGPPPGPKPNFVPKPSEPPKITAAAKPPPVDAKPSIQVDLPKKKIDGLKVTVRRPGDKT